MGPSGFQNGHPARPETWSGDSRVRILFLGDELRALRRLQREQEPRSPFVFTSERGAPFTTAGFARMIAGGWRRPLGFQAHPHMLRHACGYPLANKRHHTRASKPTLATKISSTQSIQSCHRVGSRISGGRSVPLNHVRYSAESGHCLLRVE